MDNKNHITLEKNKEGRDFIVGDLHGMYDQLMTAMEMVDFNINRDRLFCVGDMVDRGPDSEKCLKLIDEDWFYTVKGNHEEMMEDHYHNPKDHGYFHTSNGGVWFANLLVTDITTADYCAELSKDLPLTITFETKTGDRIGISHADYPSVSWNERFNISDAEFLWSRKTIAAYDRGILVQAIEDVDKVYHGHTVLKEFTQINNRFFIDTGAVFGYNGNKLRLIEIK